MFSLVSKEEARHMPEKRKPIVMDHALSTPFGTGTDAVWSALLDKRRAENAPAPPAERPEESRVQRLLDPIAAKIASWNCDLLVLASTKGEIDVFERLSRKARRESGGPPPLALFDDIRPERFLERVSSRLGIPSAVFVSSACASSNIAIAVAAEKLLSGQATRVAVIGIDIVSEFVVSGFSALGALSPSNTASPFDADRDGLVVGEACAAILLEKGLPGTGLGTVMGWGSASDANHVTGPSRNGDGLAAALGEALATAETAPSEIAAVCAHGTGTVYNDAMEIKAFERIFPSTIPTFSAKGALGHTMGAAGALETLLALETARRKRIPPTVGLKTPDKDAAPWVSPESAEIADGPVVNANSGFGGVNSVLILSL